MRTWGGAASRPQVEIHVPISQGGLGVVAREKFLFLPVIEPRSSSQYQSLYWLSYSGSKETVNVFIIMLSSI
jgi:hypothetical protein